MHVATNAGVKAFITVNYGTGTSNEAAGLGAFSQRHQQLRFQVLGDRQ